jgi:hypothetical protein
MNKRALLTLVLTALVVVPIAEARGKKPSRAPGTYKEWGPDIDEIEIVKTFKAADYDSIVVTKIDTSKTPLPDSKEKWYESAKTVLNGYTETLTEALRDELKGKMKADMVEKAPNTSRTLILRGNVLEIDPGSRAGRMLAGYGAGAAHTKLRGELADAKTGEVLVRFTQARRSAGTFKFAGGGDVQVMRDAVHAMGKDVAHIVEAFE